MSFMSQEKKKSLAPKIKELLKKHGLKGSLSVNHHSTLVLNITSGKIDLLGSYNKMVDILPSSSIPKHKAEGYLQANVYWLQNHFEGKAMEALIELRNAMNDGNHDRSDIMSDYHDVGWYVNINIGNWQKPYVVTP
jgi:hypothetical protein